MADDSQHGVFVNLLDNPERFTGYIGSSPGRIWRAIYSENCFKCALWRGICSLP